MWYVIQTRAGEEKECVSLCNKRLDSEVYREIFIPKYIAKMHFRKKWHDIVKVLFPGYFFVDTDNIEGWRKELGKIERFTRVLRNAEQIAPITHEEEAFLRGTMDKDYTIRCSTGLIIGDRICITDGPLRDYYGLIKKIDRHRRVAKLEVNLFGRMTPAEVGLEVLTRVTEKEFLQWKKENYMKDETEEDIVESGSSSYEDRFCRCGMQVKIVSGVFTGLKGIFLSKQEGRDQWRVQINLFDTPTEVVFRKEEIGF